MKLFKLLSLAGVLLLCSINSQAQIDRATKQLKSKLSIANRLNTQLTEENKNLHSYLRQLNQIISNVRDSLNAQTDLSKRLDFESKKWQESTFNVNKSFQVTQKDLATSQDEIRKLKYENEILKDPTIVRIYDVSAAKVKDTFTTRLNEASLGFQFDEENGSIKATKQFDSNAEAWWVFDKTIDVLLELNLRVAPHLYDLNRCVVYGSTNLLEKIRYSNKQYSPQEDTDKIRFYQEKALRLLEMNIRKFAVK
ncbi:MAG: hypothetical protein U5M51_10880 [Emticicia sp.]|nr:hypothetical protein [Emticicia sp.]